MTRTSRIITAHAFMMYWGAQYRSALKALKLANRWNAGKPHAMAQYNRTKAHYLNCMLELRIAYTYPKEAK